MRKILGLISIGIINEVGWVGSSEQVADRLIKLVELEIRRFVVLPHSVVSGPLSTMGHFAKHLVH